MNPGIRILPLPTAKESGISQGNFLSLGLETVLEGGWTTSWPATCRGGKETGYYHNIFPENWNFIPRKKRTSEQHSDRTLQQHSLP